jgi:hypothetical protein
VTPPCLLIGPVLRRVVGSRATVWVETSSPATVRVRAGRGAGAAGGEARTFSAFGHHYALVVVDGLPADAATPYEVLLDGDLVWPLADSAYPASVIRTGPADDGDRPVRLVFGSCRETTNGARSSGLPPDALDAYARRLAETEDLPDLLLLLGDQVYADIPSPRIRRWLRRRRRRRSSERDPDDQVVTYEEYSRLYLESWTDPEIRWLFSTVPSVMIFDDHEIIDDWNTSAAWRSTMRTLPWWPERIAAGLASYWVYQHLGNISPDDLDADPLYPKVLAAGDATELLHEFGARVDAEADVAHDPERWPAHEYQWSYALDIGRTRIVVLDNRASRVLPPAARAMLPQGEWEWFAEQARGARDHLVVGTSLPWLLPPGLHHLEAWNERLAASPRRWVAGLSERVREVLDLEHWAAFEHSFEALAALFALLGRSDPAPASISVLSGDVHHSYVARADLGPAVPTPVHQLTCSPLHNQVPSPMRPLLRLGWRPGPTAFTRALARSAGLPRTPVRWRRSTDLYFGNAVATLVHSGRSASVTIEGTTADGALHDVAAVDLAPPTRRSESTAVPGA